MRLMVPRPLQRRLLLGARADGAGDPDRRRRRRALAVVARQPRRAREAPEAARPRMKRRRMRMPAYYVLDTEHHLVRVRNVLAWARWYEGNYDKRAVDRTTISGNCFVSTVFIGLDHRFFDDGPPLVFETMIFGGPTGLDESVWRYASWDDAVTGHDMAVKKVLAAMK